MEINTPEMLNSKMERHQHRGNLVMRAMQFGSGIVGNKDIVVIDISYWQDHTRIKYAELCKNVDGVILRGTYSIWKDTRFDIHYDAIAEHGIPLGAYAYLVGNQTGVAQANTFYDAVGSRELKLGVYADIEDQRVGTKLTRTAADSFMAQTDKLFGNTTRVYTGPYAWRAIMATGGHSHRKLWIANYLVNSPMLPLNGDWATWWLWQYTEKGKLPGYHSSLDINRYNGTTAQWHAEVSGQSAPVTIGEKVDRLWKAHPELH